MKFKITAVAAGLLALSGGVNAAEPLTIAQMDTVTAGGYGDWNNVRDRFMGRNFHDRRHRDWKFGNWWHKGKWWDAKCRDASGREIYGRVSDIKRHDDKPAAAAPVAAVTNNFRDVNITITADNGAIINAVINVGSGVLTAGDIASISNPILNQPQTEKPSKQYGRWGNWHSAMKAKY